MVSGRKINACVIYIRFLVFRTIFLRGFCDITEDYYSTAETFVRLRNNVIFHDFRVLTTVVTDLRWYRHWGLLYLLHRFEQVIFLKSQFYWPGPNQIIPFSCRCLKWHFKSAITRASSDGVIEVMLSSKQKTSKTENKISLIIWCFLCRATTQ